jgi:hypothetical protein
MMSAPHLDLRARHSTIRDEVAVSRMKVVND